MNKRQIIASLVKIANELDQNGFTKTALDIDELIKRIQNRYYENMRMRGNLSPEQNLNSQTPDPDYSWSNTTRDKLRNRKIYNEDKDLKYQIIWKYEEAYKEGNLKDNTLEEVRTLLNAELKENGFVELDPFEISRQFGIKPRYINREENSNE
jgi:hypothetical protein